MEDADLDLAVNGACNARFMNAGQICVAGKRLLVHESIAKEFTRRFIERVSSYQLGHPDDEETTLSALARKDLCDKLDMQVRASVQSGARVLIGGRRSATDECGYEATVLDNITTDMPVFKEEVFGPVSSIIYFASEAQAMEIANNTPYGLGASVWTGNRARGERMALQLECGMVYVNSLLRSDIRLPFGGIKQSGFGRELGEAGFREFTNVKTIVVN
jgi:succinate-semialdehyde dehydrogenase/glutarate-semialdehyde dehydrogenase